MLDQNNTEIVQILNECLLVLGAPKEIRDVVSCWRNGISDETVISLISNGLKKINN